MNDLLEFFTKLFSDEGFMPRWVCGRWTGVNGWIYIIGDVLTGSAYFYLPRMIIQYVRITKTTLFTTLYYLFGAFIFFCGTGHWLDGLIFWYPAYRLTALVSLATGIVSWVTIIHAHKVLPTLIKQIPRQQLEEEIILRKTTEAELRINQLHLLEKTEELQSKNEQLERFAYVASHDLAEPLRKIIMNTERLNTASPEEIEMYSGKIQDSCKRMESLMKSILDYSRLAKAEFAYVDLNNVIQNTINDLEYILQESGAKVTVKGSLPTVQAVEYQMHQVFTNLITNGIKFRKPNVPPVVEIGCEILYGRELTSKSIEKLHLMTKDMLDDSYVRIYVKDNGIGFDNQYEDKIFELFQRLHTRTEYKGTGIGLSIVKRICDLHKGGVRAESVVGEGSTFFIVLPVHQSLLVEIT